jgi:hypothetical protein
MSRRPATGPQPSLRGFATTAPRPQALCAAPRRQPATARTCEPSTAASRARRGPADQGENTTPGLTVIGPGAGTGRTGDDSRMRGRDAFQDRRNHQAVPWLAHRGRQNRRGVRADAGPITVPPVRRTHLLQTTSERPSPSPRVRQPISQIAEDGNERRGGRAVPSFPTRHLARRYPTPGRWTSTITFRPLRPSTTSCAPRRGPSTTFRDLKVGLIPAELRRRRPS